MKYLSRTVAAVGCLLVPLASQAVVTEFDDEAVFLAAISGPAVTYDFEVASGFPADTTGSDPGGFADIGLFDGIDFDATAWEASLATSGVQVMTGTDGTFSTAILDFAGLADLPDALGFFALDLTTGTDELPDEIIEVTVDFLSGPDEVFLIEQVPGGTTSDPVYFGITTDDPIVSVRLTGKDLPTDPDDTSPWMLDDLTIAPAPEARVPAPPTLVLVLAGALGLLAGAGRRA